MVTAALRNTTSQRLPGIDILRLLAALGVVAFHGLFRGPHSEWGRDRFPGLEDFAVYGCLGVNMFFVISGFVIAWSSERGDVLDFVRARLLRLWPAYLFCVTLSALVLLAAGNSYFPVSMREWLTNLTFLPQLFGQDFVDGSYWTIVFEITFYGFVAVGLATGLYPRRLLAIGWVWLAISIFNATLLDSKLIKHVLLTNYSGEFLGGLLLYRMFRGDRRPATLALLVACVVTSTQLGCVRDIYFAQLQLGYEMNSTIMRALIVSGFVLVAAASQLRLSGIAGRAAVVAGGLTYPIYLLHQDVEYTLLPKLVDLGVTPLAGLGALVAVLLLVSYLVFRFVEPLGRLWLAALVDPALPALRGLTARVVLWVPKWGSRWPGREISDPLLQARVDRFVRSATS